MIRSLKLNSQRPIRALLLSLRRHVESSCVLPLMTPLHPSSISFSNRYSPAVLQASRPLPPRNPPSMNTHAASVLATNSQRGDYRQSTAHDHPLPPNPGVHYHPFVRPHSLLPRLDRQSSNHHFTVQATWQFRLLQRQHQHRARYDPLRQSLDLVLRLRYHHQHLLPLRPVVVVVVLLVVVVVQRLSNARSSSARLPVRSPSKPRSSGSHDMHERHW